MSERMNDLYRRVNECRDKDRKLWGECHYEADNQIHAKYSMFCACGKLCTGLHAQFCKRFQEQVMRRGIKLFKERYIEPQPEDQIPCGGNKCTGACGNPPCVTPDTKYIIQLGGSGYICAEYPDRPICATNITWSSTRFEVFDDEQTAQKFADMWNRNHILSNNAKVKTLKVVGEWTKTNRTGIN